MLPKLFVLQEVSRFVLLRFSNLFGLGCTRAELGPSGRYHLFFDFNFYSEVVCILMTSTKEMKTNENQNYY